MNRLRLLLFAVASVPLLIRAQPVRLPAAATDANATVAPLQYQSAFAGDQSIANSEDTPDKIWVKANRDLLGRAKHDDHGTAPMPVTPTPAAVSKSEATPAIQNQPDPHMHKKGQ